MFRAQQNAFDDAVAKATDENLTSENWEYIMDVCDRANANDSGPKDVVAALIKRLAHRNANVQLYTLELANALSQNCGVKVHRELASRSFTDAMLRLANDRNTHQQVKAKILERMQEWTTMFANDRDLGIMEQAYMRLKNQHPNLHPPSKPVKQQITEADRQKEDDELQMALELSVKTQQQPPAGQTTQGYAPNGGEASNQHQPGQAVPSGTTAATVSRVRALFDFQPSEPGELQFKKGDIIAVLESVYKDWWKGSLRGQTGIFPLNYVEKLSDPTQEELTREAQMEAEVFAEIKNVEKLLTLLSTSNTDTNVRDNEEITTLYHSTLAIRPKLIELIGKYSQRKDDFTQLNEKFIKARRDYEALLEASMSQPPPHAGYGRPVNYNYPTAGYPPQPHDPGRYYSQTPQDSRQNVPQHAPQNGPQPFYMAGQAPSIQTHSTAYMPSDPRTESPAGMAPPASLYAGQQPPAQQAPSQHQPPAAGQARPTSHYEQQHPHELGTSSYASPPVDGGRRQSYPPQFQQAQAPQQQGSVDYSPSVYTPDDPYAAMVPHQQQQQHQQVQQQHTGPNPYPAPLNVKPPPAGTHTGYDPSSPYSQRPPSQPPPAPPGGAGGYGGPSSPVGGGAAQHNPYPNLAAGQQPPTQYQAYQPPRQDQYGSPGPAGGGGNPSDFYR